MATLFSTSGCRSHRAKAPPENSVRAWVTTDGGLAASRAAGEPIVNDDSIRDGDGVGQRAPGFSVPSATNRGNVLLRRGHVSVIYFWATWCEPCRASLPQLSALADRLKDEGLDMIGLSLDDTPTYIPDFLRANSGRFTVGWDSGAVVAHRYAVQVVPSAYVIDREGRIRFAWRGYALTFVPDLETQVRSLL